VGGVGAGVGGVGAGVDGLAGSIGACLGGLPTSGIRNGRVIGGRMDSDMLQLGPNY
jgi:hypothetical protein